jgi:hypothetical protein
MQKPPTFVGGLRAQNRIRTYTRLPTLRPEHSASTNFAIWASNLLRDIGFRRWPPVIQGCKYKKRSNYSPKKYEFPILLFGRRRCFNSPALIGLGSHHKYESPALHQLIAVEPAVFQRPAIKFSGLNIHVIGSIVLC